MSSIGDILRDGESINLANFRQWLGSLSGSVDRTKAVIATGTIAAIVGERIYEDRDALEADLDHDAGLYAMVVSDGDVANNDLYGPKTGAAGTGSWGEPLGIIRGAAEAAAEAAVAAAIGAPVATSVVLSALQPLMETNFVGRPGVLAGGDQVNTGQYVFAEQRKYIGKVKRVFVRGGNTGGELKVRAYTRSGDVWTKVGEEVTLTVVADINQQFDLIDFYQMPGVYLGFYCALGVVASTAEPADSGGWYSGASTGDSFTDATPYVGSIRLQVGFMVEEASRMSRCAPLSIVVGGNSITEATGGATPAWEMLAEELGITIVNQGVSGRTMSVMLEAYDSDIKPYAVQPGFRTMAILDGEPYNEMIVNSTSIDECIDMMAEWCDAAREDGFDYVGVANSIDMNTADNSPVQGSWDRDSTKDALNAALDARWSEFAHFLIDYGSAPAFQDYTNSTIYQSDGQHPKTAGQLVRKNRSRAAMAPFL